MTAPKGNNVVPLLYNHAVRIPDEEMFSVAKYVCGISQGVEDAKYLLDVLGIHKQPEGTYALSESEAMALGKVCPKGHPLTK